MSRYYAEAIENGYARMAPEDARHALRVMRLKAGDACELICDGARYAATLEAIEAEDRVLLKVGQRLPDTEARLHLTLFQGLPKGEKMELIAQKAVELGAAAVVPVQMSRSVARLDVRDAERKRERWQKIAREAGKQSGRCAEMQVGLPCSWKQFLPQLAAFDLVLVPWEEARGTSLTDIRRAHPVLSSAALIIGPEGGISPEEIAQLQSAGAIPITLGPRILRTETAAIAAITAMMTLYGEMG